MDSIKKEKNIYICDVGLYSFEPNEKEFKKLEQSKLKDKKNFFQKGDGDGTEKILNIYTYHGWTSFLKPETNYIKKFHNFKDASKIVDKVSIKTEKLDDINFKNKIDFFQIDVQGLESTFIENGAKKISDALVVQMKLSPVPTYKNEKNLTNVLNLMEKLNFNLNMFHNINTRIFKPMMKEKTSLIEEEDVEQQMIRAFKEGYVEFIEIAKSTSVGLHTLFQLDCVFVKNYNEIEKLDKEELKKLILIMFYSYKSYDFVHYLISHLDKISNTNYLNDYRKLYSALKKEKIL